MIVILPYPDKALWPNGRPHWAEKARQAKKHREWARIASTVIAKLIIDTDQIAAIDLLVTVHGKPSGPMPDKDGVIGSCKAYFDGISDALGVNDRLFNAPSVQFAGRYPHGQFAISVTPLVNF